MALMIDDAASLESAIAQGSYSSVGSYPLFFITADGEAVAPDYIAKNKAEALRRLEDGERARVIALEVNWEDPALYCTETNERIESAYAEDT